MLSLPTEQLLFETSLKEERIWRERLFQGLERSTDAALGLCAGPQQHISTCSGLSGSRLSWGRQTVGGGQCSQGRTPEGGIHFTARPAFVRCGCVSGHLALDAR